MVLVKRSKNYEKAIKAAYDLLVQYPHPGANQKTGRNFFGIIGGNGYEDLSYPHREDLHGH